MKKRWFLIPLLLLAVPVFAFQARLFPVLGARPTVEEQERYAASEAYDPDTGVFQNRRPEVFAQMRENMEFLPMARKWFSERVDGRPASRLPVDDDRLSEISLQAGIRFVPVVHAGNSQASEEEAQAIHRMAENLLGQTLRTSAANGTTRPLGWEDLLFVAPYNQQVKLLKECLGGQARVGSVDKFQGQEAAVVFVSLCSSDATDAPRGIDFLFNPNRLNAAISRAQTLVIVVGHPGLATTRVSTVEQLRKVNLVAALIGQSFERE